MRGAVGICDFLNCSCTVLGSKNLINRKVMYTDKKSVET